VAVGRLHRRCRRELGGGIGRDARAKLANVDFDAQDLQQAADRRLRQHLAAEVDHRLQRLDRLREQLPQCSPLLGRQPRQFRGAEDRRKTVASGPVRRGRRRSSASRGQGLGHGDYRQTRTFHIALRGMRQA